MVRFTKEDLEKKYQEGFEAGKKEFEAKKSIKKKSISSEKCQKEKKRISVDLTCSVSDLCSSIELVNNAISLMPSHPILANILFVAESKFNKISLTGFDLNLGILIAFEAKNVKRDVSFTLPAKLFLDFLRKFPSSSLLSISHQNDSVVIDIERASYKFEVSQVTENYPQLPFVESGISLNIKSSSFLKAVNSTIFASSKDESKQLLTGVNFKFKQNHIESASTDGHRLAVNLIDNIENPISNEDDISITIPTSSLLEIEKLVGLGKSENSIKLFYDRGNQNCINDKGQVVFVLSNGIITTRTLNGIYPNYSQLIPDTFSNEFIFDRIDLINSIERLGVLANQQSNVIKFKFDPKNIKISVDVQDLATGFECFETASAGDDFEEFDIAFNFSYLHEGLKVIASKNVILKCNLPTTPAVLVPEDKFNSFTYLVMPVQLRA